MAGDKKEPQRHQGEGGGILIPILVAAMVCVAMTTTFIVGYGLQYTAEQRAIEVQQSESAAPVRSMPSQRESPVQTVSAPPEPTGSEPQQPEEHEPADEGQPVAPSPSVNPPESVAPSARQSPSSASPVSQSPTPSVKPSESQAPASQVQSNTPQTPAGSGGGDGFDTERFDRPNWGEKGNFLGAKDSNKYHRKNCGNGAARIRPENEVWFDTEEQAKAAGYERCGICW